MNETTVLGLVAEMMLKRIADAKAKRQAMTAEPAPLTTDERLATIRAERRPRIEVVMDAEAAD